MDIVHIYDKKEEYNRNLNFLAIRRLGHKRKSVRLNPINLTLFRYAVVVRYGGAYRSAQ